MRKSLAILRYQNADDGIIDLDKITYIFKMGGTLTHPWKIWFDNSATILVSDITYQAIKEEITYAKVEPLLIACKWLEKNGFGEAAAAMKEAAQVEELKS